MSQLNSCPRHRIQLNLRLRSKIINPGIKSVENKKNTQYINKIINPLRKINVLPLLKTYILY